MAHVRQELDAGGPLLLGQPDLPGKRVQVLDQAGHDLLEPAVLHIDIAGQYRLGNGLFIEIAHGACSLKLPAAGYALAPSSQRGQVRFSTGMSSGW
ncbi:hypothetical protein D3C72_2135640 [compost metagenome]